MAARVRRSALLAFVGALLIGPAAAFDLQGHRGARGLMPENTLPAFATALSLGVTTLELDVAITRDGHVVIAHDRALNSEVHRQADGDYVSPPGPALHGLTLAELKSYDFGVLRPGSKYAAQFPEQRAIPGTRVPTLAELADLVRKSGNAAVRFNIETKLSPLSPEDTVDPETFAATLVKALRDTGLAERATIQSFDWRTLKVVQRIAPEIPTVCLTLARGAGDNLQIGRPGPSPWLAGLDIEDFGGSVPRLVKAAGCAVWSPFYRDLTEATLAEARASGLSVVAWTVNDRADMVHLIDMGVDGIITDYPDRLRAVMSDKGMPLPAATPITP